MAGSGELHLLPEVALPAAGELSEIATELKTQLKRLVADADEVLGGSWRGEAASKFTESWDGFHEGATSLVEGAEGIAELVRNSCAALINQDGQNASGIGDVR